MPKQIGILACASPVKTGGHVTGNLAEKNPTRRAFRCGGSFLRSLEKCRVENGQETPLAAPFAWLLQKAPADLQLLCDGKKKENYRKGGNSYPKHSHLWNFHPPRGGYSRADESFWERLLFQWALPVEIQGSSKKNAWPCCWDLECMLEQGNCAYQLFCCSAAWHLCKRWCGFAGQCSSRVWSMRSIVLLVLPWARQVCGASLDLGRKIWMPCCLAWKQPAGSNTTYKYFHSCDMG